MPRELNGVTYYRTTEVCQQAGISKGTLFRWIRESIIPDAGITDRNGWRLFTTEEIARIRKLVGTFPTNKTTK